MKSLTTTREQGAMSVTEWEYHPKRHGLVTKKTYGFGASLNQYRKNPIPRD